MQDLDAGYRFDFSMLGVVFERVGAGAHVDEDEPGYEVHRFGLDAANRLIEAACGRFRRGWTTSQSDSTITSDPSGPSSPSAAPAKQDSEFSSFRDANDRGSPSISTMVPESQRRESTVPMPGGPSAPEPRNAEESEGTLEGSKDARGASKEGMEVRATEEPTSSVDAAPREEEPPHRSPKETAGAVLVSDSVLPEPDAPADSLPFVSVTPDVLVGATEMTSQYGILGKCGSATVGIDLNGCNTVSLFGVQGFGNYLLDVRAWVRGRGHEYQVRRYGIS